MKIKNHLYKKGFALGLVLKQRLAASRKWPMQSVLLVKIAVILVMASSLRRVNKTN